MAFNGHFGSRNTSSSLQNVYNLNLSASENCLANNSSNSSTDVSQSTSSGPINQSASSIPISDLSIQERSCPDECSSSAPSSIETNAFVFSVSQSESRIRQDVPLEGLVPCNMQVHCNLSKSKSESHSNLACNISQPVIVQRASSSINVISTTAITGSICQMPRAKTLTVNAVSACLPRPVRSSPSAHRICGRTPVYSSLASPPRPPGVPTVNNSNFNVCSKEDLSANNALDGVPPPPVVNPNVENITAAHKDVEGDNPVNADMHMEAAVPTVNRESEITIEEISLDCKETSSPMCKAVLMSENEQELSHVNEPQTINNGPLYNWQATMTTVKERVAFLFNNEVLSDVHFVVGKGTEAQRIPAHKFVLSVGSAVFDAMFNGRLSTQQKEIELPDVEPQAFLALLRFLYSDDVQIGPETVMTVLYTAKKYAVPALERQCVEFLKSNLSADNAFMLLSQARLFDEPQLSALCLETIDKNTAESLDAEGFCEIDRETLRLVLKRDTLRIREAKLFEAVVRWADAECERDGITSTPSQQRKVLGQCLSLIRYPLMTVEEFAQGPAQSGILTDQEVVQLFLYFTVNPKPSVKFLDVPRCCMTGKEQTVCRFQQIESRWGYSGTSDRIRFAVDRRIFVVGFGMYGSIHGPSKYDVIIQILYTATGKVCASNDTSFTTDGTVNTFRVMFKEPVEILPSTNYTAYATLKGPDSHYGTKGVRKVCVDCPSGDRVTFQFTYAAGNNNGTSVEDGQIPEIIFYT